MSDLSESRPRVRVGAVAHVTDLSERRLLEQALREARYQLEHAQRLASVGLLVAEIAHDFNNLLTVIRGYSELLLERLSNESDRADAQEVQRAAESAAELAHHLLRFCRRQRLDPRLVDLNAAVRESSAILEQVLSDGRELVMRLQPELGAVHVDQGAIERVLLNLAVNARDAMPERGELTIETANVEIDGTGFVSLAVADTGIGMDEATQRRVFEPFFTTKRSGCGTGLGLATVHGIVSASGGRILVDSAPGAGTRFTILFPQAEQ